MSKAFVMLRPLLQGFEQFGTSVQKLDMLFRTLRRVVGGGCAILQIEREWDVARNTEVEQAAIDAQSDPGILGGMGRMGTGRDGFVHLCHGAGSGAARITATLWISGDHREKAADGDADRVAHHSQSYRASGA